MSRPYRDSFESDSPSEDDDEDAESDDDDDGVGGGDGDMGDQDKYGTSRRGTNRRPQKQKRDAGKYDIGDDSTSRLNGHNNRSNALDINRDDYNSNKRDAVAENSKPRSKDSSSREARRRQSGSASDTGNPARNHSTDFRRKSSGVRFGKGDRVRVVLGSGRGSETGTITCTSSRGSYDVALDNGDVEKRVHPQAISALRGNPSEEKLLTAPHRQGDENDSLNGDKSLDGQRGQPPSDYNDDRRAPPLKRQQSQADPTVGSPSSRSIVSIAHGVGGGVDRREILDGSSPFSSEPESPAASVSAAGGGGSPIPQPLSATATGVGVSSGAVQCLPLPAHGSGNPSKPRTEVSSSDGDSSTPSSPSPLRSKVRQQAEGLLKTVRWIVSCTWYLVWYSVFYCTMGKPKPF